MKKFIPYDKLSKRKQHEIDKKRRVTWGSLNPVTRKPPDSKVYNRKKTQMRDQDDDFKSASFFAVTV